MRSEATHIDDYLAELSAELRDIVASLRHLVHAHLPQGWDETMNWGMISYDIPLEKSGKTYNGKPLMFAAIGAQKHHVGLYLCGLYCKADRKAAFEAAYTASGRKLDMGKSCLRIRHKDQIDPDSIAQALSAVTVEELIEASRR